jgi:hypothetical protein
VGLTQTPQPIDDHSSLKIIKESNKMFMMHKIELTFHSLPKSLNKALRSNRFKNHQSNKNWDMIVFGTCRNQIPKEPLKKARIRIVRHFYRTLDYDGLVGSLKPVVDALVSAGVLESDSWNVLGVWDVTQEFRPKSQGPLLTVSIQEI